MSEFVISHLKVSMMYNSKNPIWGDVESKLPFYQKVRPLPLYIGFQIQRNPMMRGPEAVLSRLAGVFLDT